MLIIITISGWGIFLGLLAFGLRRGSSAMFCTGLLLLGAMLLSSLLSPSFAQPSSDGHTSAQVMQGYWQLFLFLPLAIIAFPLGAYINRFLQWSIDPFDHLLGFIFGLFTAGIIVRFVLITLLLIASSAPDYPVMDKLFLVRQTVHLEGWHR